MEKLNVGIIGAGGMAINHIRAYSKYPLVEITALCDTNLNIAKMRAAEYKIPNVYDDYRKMLNCSDINAVSIVTPNITHSEFTIEALNQGKHVLCEKPPGLNASEVIKMVDTAKKNGKLLMFGFNSRFSEKVQYIRKFCEKGNFNDIYYVKTGYIRRCGNPGGWFATKELSGGGALIDLGVHMIDLALYLMGGPEPEAVFACTFSEFGKRSGMKGIKWYTSAGYESGKFDVEDMATALIKFKNGAALFLEASFDMHMKPREEIVYLEIMGNKAGAKVEPGFEIYMEKDNYLVDLKPVFDDDTLDWGKCTMMEINHFADCILKGIPCISPAEEAISVMKIVDAIYESSYKGVSVHF